MNLHPPEVIIHLHGALTMDEAVVTVTETVTGIGAVNERAADEEDQNTGRHQAIVIRAEKGEGVCVLGIGSEFQFYVLLQI